MVKRKGIIFLIVIMLTGVSGKFLFGSQNIIVSNKTSGRNIIPRLAINSFTGDILVVWTQQVPGTLNVRVWARLLKLQSNGKYKKKKTLMASPSDGYHANANVVFIPWKKKFLVTWDTFNFTLGLSSASIMARVVNKQGRPSGKVITVVSDGMANTWPHVIAMPYAGSAKRSTKNRLFLAYTAFPATPSEEGGVVLTKLTNNFKPQGKLQLIKSIKFNSSVSALSPRNPETNFRMDQLTSLAFINNLVDQDGAIGASGRETFQNNQTNFSTRAWLFYGDPTGKIKGCVTDLGDDTTNVDLIVVPDWTADGPRAHALFGSTRMSMFVTGTFEAEFLDDVHSGDLDGYLLIGSQGTDSIDGAYLPRNYDNDIPGQNADLPLRRSTPPNADILSEEQFAHLIYSRSGKIFTKDMFLKSTGEITFSSKEVRRFSHGKNIRWLESDSAPELGVRAIVWGKYKNSVSEEVRIHIY